MSVLLKKTILSIILLLIFGASIADERILRKQDSVTERRHSKLEAIGRNVGAFKVFPKLGFNSEYNDNIFDTQVNERQDYIAHIQPGIKVLSDWNRHALKLDIDSNIALYADNPDQNYQDMKIRLSGQLDILHNSTLNLGYSFYKSHEDRNSPDQRGGKNPTFYNTHGFNLSYQHKLNRFFTKVGMKAHHIEYDNNTTTLGTRINHQDRNHWYYEPSIRFGYEIQPEYNAFVDFRYTGIDYDDRFDDNGFERESSGYEALAGFAFDATGLITGDIAVGYQYKRVEDSRLSKLAGLTGRLNVEWSITPLMTIHSRIYRSIHESTLSGVSGVFVTKMNVGVEHELLRQLLLSVDFDYDIRDYNGYDRRTANKDRDEATYGISVGGKYIFSRYLSADLSYQYRQRNVNRDLRDYQTNQVFLNFVGRI